MKLVIVDDMPINRKLLRVMLEAEGHATLEAADGVEALQILNREKVDAVISDVLMPRMDGYRLCHEIRTNEQLCEVPVIIYTSTYIEPSDEKLALALGADRYLKKPAPAATILATLKEAVAMSTPRAGTRRGARGRGSQRIQRSARVEIGREKHRAGGAAAAANGRRRGAARHPPETGDRQCKSNAEDGRAQQIQW